MCSLSGVRRGFHGYATFNVQHGTRYGTDVRLGESHEAIMACNSTFAFASVANHSIDEHICMHHARTISGSLEWPADPPFELILWNSFRQVLEL